MIKANRDEFFDPAIMKELGTLGAFGSTLKDYGGAGVSSVAYGLIAREIEKIDSGYRSAFTAQNLAVLAIEAYGSVEQKNRYLPKLSEIFFKRTLNNRK